jgi:hypothetical protein
MRPDLSPSPAEELISEELEIEAEEIDDLSEQLAVHSLMSEERHTEIISGVTTCQENLAQIAQQVQQISSQTAAAAESPSLTLILERLGEIQSRLSTLQKKVDGLNPSQTVPASLTLQPSQSETPPEGAAVLPVAEPAAAPAPEPAPKRRVFRRI